MTGLCGQRPGGKASGGKGGRKQEGEGRGKQGRHRDPVASRCAKLNPSPGLGGSWVQTQPVRSCRNQDGRGNGAAP